MYLYLGERAALRQLTVGYGRLLMIPLVLSGWIIFNLIIVRGQMMVLATQPKRRLLVLFLNFVLEMSPCQKLYFSAEKLFMLPDRGFF